MVAVHGCVHARGPSVPVLCELDVLFLEITVLKISVCCLAGVPFQCEFDP